MLVTQSRPQSCGCAWSEGVGACEMLGVTLELGLGLMLGSRASVRD